MFGIFLFKSRFNIRFINSDKISQRIIFRSIRAIINLLIEQYKMFYCTNKTTKLTYLK